MKRSMIFPLDLQLKTARCLLRHPSEADIPHIFAATRFPGFNDGMFWNPPADPIELLKPLQENCEAWRTGTAYVFTIEDHNGKFLGRIAIRRTTTADLWDLGFWTHPEVQGKGYMTETVGRIIEFGFQELAATEIQACHATWNEASKRVLEKCGMIWREHIPHGFQKNGVWVAEERHSIARDSIASGRE